MTQEIPQETTASADPIDEIKADIAAYESIFAELTRAMDPAALLKVLTYLGRNAKRDASEKQTFDTLEHRRLIARIDALMAQVQPEARKQAMTLRAGPPAQGARQAPGRQQAPARRQALKHCGTQTHQEWTPAGTSWKRVTSPRCWP